MMGDANAGKSHTVSNEGIIRHAAAANDGQFRRLLTVQERRWQI